MKILLGFLFLPFLSTGQITFQGSVINKTNHKNVSFATIRLLNENVEIDADEKGHFKLISVNPKKNDTLIISSVGYETLEVPLDNLPLNMIFFLEEKLTTLNGVFFNSKRQSTFKSLNSFSNCGTAYIGNGSYVTQVAQHFHSDTSDFLLKEVEVCKYALPLIDPDKCIFRLRIYSMNSFNGAPNLDLTDSVIEVITRERRTIVNLEKYKIYITEKDFFVAVEWVKIPFNLSNGKGKRNRKISYNPLIAFKSKPKNDFYENYESWIKNNKDKWEPISYASRLMISATIKF